MGILDVGLKEVICFVLGFGMGFDIGFLDVGLEEGFDGTHPKCW